MNQINRPDWLLDCASNIHSQSGEDGIIEKILSILPDNDGWCVEFGARDGKYMCNSLALIERGYNALLIEGNKKKFRELQENYADNNKVKGGLYSIVAKARHHELEVHAFEPDRTNLCQLYANLFVNGMQTNTQVHEHGISNHYGKASFDTSPATSSRGARRKSDTGNTEISVRRLDNVLTCSGKTLVVKIDIEGHECEATEGAGHFLTNNQCYLQVESAPEKFAALNKRMTDLGYRHVHTCGDHYFTNMDDA